MFSCVKYMSIFFRNKLHISAMQQKGKTSAEFPVAGVVGGLFAAVVVIGIAILVFLLWRRRKRKLKM